MKQVFIIAGLFLFAGTALKGQDIYYTINIGTFIDAKAQDFASIRSIGFLHAYQLEGSVSQIYLGGYYSKAAAEADLQKVRSGGYTGAYLQENFPNNGRTLTLIQIAALPVNQPIDWEKYQQAGPLYALLNNDEMKLTVGIFNSIDDARQALPGIRSKGFRDAFIKNVNSIYVHELGAFETNNAIKKPLIPLDLKEQPEGTAVPTNYNPPTFNTGNRPPSTTVPPRTTTPKGMVINARPGSTLPEIRVQVKRRSALELQKVLKEQGIYTSSLDGYYGNGTKEAYQNFLDNNREMRKYQILAPYLADPGTSTGDRLQQAINELPSNPSGVDGYNQPVALAYRAYVLFTSMGPSLEVNNLMNQAIKMAFSSPVNTQLPPFNPRATYAYNNLSQLIEHLYFIHAAQANGYLTPCWLMQRHPQETAQANAVFAGYESALRMQSCDEFTQWQEIQVLLAVASEFNLDPRADLSALTSGSSARSALYMAGKPLSAGMQAEVDQWNLQLWENAAKWGRQDIMNQRILTALKVAYFQAQVRLEDFYMDKGFSYEEARPLALATMRTLVGYYLNRFAN